MNPVIESDLFRYGGLSGKKGLSKGLRIPGFKYTYLIRKVQQNKNNPLRRKFFQLLKKRYEYKYGFQIPAEVQIGKGFYIGHFGTVIISPKVIIGENCNISPGVTIGRANRGWIEGCPVIGNRVWIGTNAVVVGKITIGSNVLIAPNSTVSIDVPDNSMVRGNPAKVVHNEDATKGYINNILE